MQIHNEMMDSNQHIILLILLTISSLHPVGSTDNSTTTTTTILSTTVSNNSKSDWEQYGLPILLLVSVLFVFGLVYWAGFVLPETRWFKECTSYNKLEEEDNSAIGQTLKRKNSLKQRLQRYRQKSRAQGWDGQGGSTQYYDLPYTKPTTQLQELEEDVSDRKFYGNTVNYVNKAFELDMTGHSEMRNVVSFDGASARVEVNRPVAYVTPLLYDNNPEKDSDSDSADEHQKRVAVDIHNYQIQQTQIEPNSLSSQQYNYKYINSAESDHTGIGNSYINHAYQPCCDETKYHVNKSSSHRTIARYNEGHAHGHIENGPRRHKMSSDLQNTVENGPNGPYYEPNYMYNSESYAEDEKQYVSNHEPQTYHDTDI